MRELPTQHDWLEAMTCETCESEIDLPDEFTELGVCRHCGVTFLVDAGQDRGGSSRAS